MQQKQKPKICDFNSLIKICLGGIFMMNNYWDSFDCEIQCEDVCEEYWKELMKEVEEVPKD